MAYHLLIKRQSTSKYVAGSILLTKASRLPLIVGLASSHPSSDSYKIYKARIILVTRILFVTFVATRIDNLSRVCFLVKYLLFPLFSLVFHSQSSLPSICAKAPAKRSSIVLTPLQVT
jgi:hypothetical protein